MTGVRGNVDRLLTGRGRFIDNLPMPRSCLHAVIVRSTVAHGRIASVDLDAACRSEGVAAAYSGTDIKEVLGSFPVIVDSAPAYYAIASDRVRYVGEPVAVVLAKTAECAADAAELVDVEYEPLPAVTTVEEAMDKSAPLLHAGTNSNVPWERLYTYGEPASAFANAADVIRLELQYPRYNSTPLETYGVLAEYAPSEGTYSINSNFQGPFTLLTVLAHALRVPLSQVRVVVPEDIGGSFGNKAMIYPYMGLIAACARLSGRPVRWIETRSEHFLASSSGTDRRTCVEAAITTDGRVSAVRFDISENVGAYLRAPEPSGVMRALTTFNGPYRIEHGEIRVRAVLTNKLPTGLNRGYGGQHHAFTLERAMDEVAHKLGEDPTNTRMRHFYPADAFPLETTTGSVYDSGDYKAVLERAMERADYQRWRERQPGLRDAGRHVGLGVATVVHSAGANIGYATLSLSAEERERPGYHPKSGSAETAAARLSPSGQVVVDVATAAAGQGHVQTLVRLVSELLHVPAPMIEVANVMDTARSDWGVTSGSYSSRFSAITAPAVAEACEGLRTNILDASSHLLHVPAEELRMQEGVVVSTKHGETLRLRDLAGALQWNRDAFPKDFASNLSVTASFSPSALGPPDKLDRMNAASTYGFMADIAIVEVDVDTGGVSVLDYVAVHDVGRVLDPAGMEGQMYGGIVHGLSGALYEELGYDEEGQPMGASFMSHLPAAAPDVPHMVLDHVNAPSLSNPLGAKGAGESSAMSAPAAVASAVEDALRPWAVRITRLPITPYEIWRSVRPDLLL